MKKMDKQESYNKCHFNHSFSQFEQNIKRIKRKEYIRKLLASKPKWKIVELKKEIFIVQQFIGFWKLGIYLDVAKPGAYKYNPRNFEHNTIEEAKETMRQVVENAGRKPWTAKTLITFNKIKK